MATLKEIFPEYLRTERLTLQFFNYSDEHYETLLGIMNSPTAHRTMGDFGMRTRADLEKKWENSNFYLHNKIFTNGVADGICAYVARLGCDRDDGEPIGLVSLAHRTVDTPAGPVRLPPDLGWGLLEPYMGKGYATEAARELQRFLMGVLHFHDIVAFPNDDHVLSNRVATKLGFVPAGKIPNLDEPGRMVALLKMPGMGDMKDLGIDGGISFKGKEGNAES